MDELRLEVIDKGLNNLFDSFLKIPYSGSRISFDMVNQNQNSFSKGSFMGRGTESNIWTSTRNQFIEGERNNIRESNTIIFTEGYSVRYIKN